MYENKRRANLSLFTKKTQLMLHQNALLNRANHLPLGKTEVLFESHICPTTLIGIWLRLHIVYNKAI